MGRYPAESLDSKLEWMRAKQRKRAEKEARKAAPRKAVPLDSPVLPQMLRVKQVARALAVSETTVRAWFGKRAIIVKAHSNSVMLIPQRAFDEWIREHSSR